MLKSTLQREAQRFDESPGPLPHQESTYEVGIPQTLN